MFFDRLVVRQGASRGIIFVSPLGVRMRYVVWAHFPASNNAAEYEALISGLHIAIELGIRRLEVKGDSRLVVDQVMKDSSCLSPKMLAYCQVVCELEDKFDGLVLTHIPRRSNEVVDTLSKMASQRQAVPHRIFASDIHKPSIRYLEEAQPDGGTSASDSGGCAPGLGRS